VIRNQERTWLVQSELLMGMVYSQFATGPTPTFTIMAKNIGFLFKNVPFAAKKAEDHLKKAIELSKELGLKSFNGIGYLQLGFYLKQAGEVLESLTN
jgi:hypothetical protein